MFNLTIKLYNKISTIIGFVLIFLIPDDSISINFSTSNRYTLSFKSKNLDNRFYTFINSPLSIDSSNKENNSVTKWTLFEKPIYQTTPIPNSAYPKHITLDYENLLRSHDPSHINFNTTLTGFPGINLNDIDDLYGKIYDRKVLMKQMRYFLENDDFHSIHRLMKYNSDVFNKRECELLANDFDHLIHCRLKYEFPEPDNMHRTMPFLVSRYVLQHVMQQDLESRKSYIWLKPGEIPEDIPEFTEDYVEPASSPEKPIHIRDTYAYRSLIHKLKNYEENFRLCSLRDLYYRLIKTKRKKLLKGLRRFQRLKPFRSLRYRRKVRNKINIDRVSPFLSRPMRCTDEIVKEYTDHFEEAVNKQDLATACRLINRYGRRIIFIDKFPLLKKFMRLFAEVHSCRKYHLESLKRLRSLYWSTVKRKRFLIRYNEPMMIMEAGKTLKDMYEEQLEQYRQRRDKENDERMKRMGIDMDKVRDFSNAYGDDWIPILYPEEYEEGLKYHRERLEKLRKKVEKVREQEKIKMKTRLEGLGDIRFKKKNKKNIQNQDIDEEFQFM